MDQVDYELVLDNEFDALNLEVRPEDEELSKKYPAKLHARKVAFELAAGQVAAGQAAPRHSLLYLPGEPEKLYENSDMGPRFRQRRYFYYITGVNFADCAVTYEIERDHLTLWIPYIEPRQILWFGRQPDAAKAMSLYDVDDVRYVSELPRFFKAHLRHDTTLYVLSKDQRPFAPGSSRSSSGVDGVSSLPVGGIDYSSLRPAMDRARVVKTPHEIALIRKANDVSSAAHRDVARALLRLRNEQEVEAVFRAGCTARGAHDQSYPIIAGAGANAATLHYGANDASLKGRQLLVLDAGCDWNVYASDVTRTLPIGGNFSPEADAIHALVEAMQDQCIDMMGPGVAFRDVHRHAALVAGRGLLKLGILVGDEADIKASGIAAAFFPHGLGHHVGLEVHDVAGDEKASSSSLSSRLEGGKRAMVTPNEMAAMISQSGEEVAANCGDDVHAQARLLEPNMIVTVEPGIYFCREFIEGYFLSRPEYVKLIDTEVLERYYDVGGVRIEDDILVTEDGYENLTTAPKGSELLDIINGKE